MSEPEKKTPLTWAARKGLVVLAKDGSVDYRRKIPWEFDRMVHEQRWPDSAADPTFTVSETEFDAARPAVED